MTFGGGTLQVKPAGLTGAAGGGLTSEKETSTRVGGVLGVKPGALPVSAVDSSKIYGQDNPPFSVSYAGFVNGDDASTLGGTLVFATNADASSSVGDYLVTRAGERRVG